MKGMLMEIQRFCLQDGPGIRTTVFFKGCNMHCIWCHNPESMEQSPTLMFSADKCCGCGKCRDVCVHGVHSFDNLDGAAGTKHVVDRSRCVHCGLCIDVCYAQALRQIGKLAGLEEVMEEIKKDRNYYTSSGGGVTFSGGEAALQYEFLMELLRRCKGEGFHTALETNGLISEKRLEELSRVTDLFLLDYKATGNSHQRLTGATADQVLASLNRLHTLGSAVLLRCPLVPGINDTQEHLEAIRELKERYSCIQDVEIMAYHDIGKGKWQECGKQYSLQEIKTVSSDQKKYWEQVIKTEQAE